MSPGPNNQNCGPLAISGISPSYQGWPGLPLKQILGQLDLQKQLNHLSSAESKKRKLDDGGQPYDLSSKTALNEVNVSKNIPLDQEGQSAWLGPQLWSRQVGVDFSSADILDKRPDQVASTSGVQSRDKSEDFPSCDLALASAPGISFDPRVPTFSADDLKPQPIIRKRTKHYVAESEKTEKYWTKRITNNVAARKSREARRLKENQIALRAAYLERENSNLRDQVRNLTEENEDMQKTVNRLKETLERFERNATA